jgi:hypothetical protein
MPTLPPQVWAAATLFTLGAPQFKLPRTSHDSLFVLADAGRCIPVGRLVSLQAWKARGVFVKGTGWRTPLASLQILCKAPAFVNCGFRRFVCVLLFMRTTPQRFAAD